MPTGAFGTVAMVADEAALLEGAARLRSDLAVVGLSLAGDLLAAIDLICGGNSTEAVNGDAR